MQDVQSSLQHVGCRTYVSSCGVWDLVPGPGIEPRPPALGVQILSSWTIRKVSMFLFYVCESFSFVNNKTFAPCF